MKQIRRYQLTRTPLVSALAVLLGVATIAAVTLLQQHTTASNRAQVKLAHAEAELNQLQVLPMVEPGEAAGAEIGQQIRDSKRRLTATLRDLQRQSPPAALQDIEAPLRANFDAIDQVLALTGSGMGEQQPPRPDELRRFAAVARTLKSTQQAMQVRLAAASREYEERASNSQLRSLAGAASAILLLLAVFSFFYARSVRLNRENQRLLEASRREATLDALTGLRNRRALIEDLAAQLERPAADRNLVLALFDLDGFKQYNDTFGHPAGDALLTRLGDRLEHAVDGLATAYRMGGDEFCVLATTGLDDGREIVQLAASALSESGDAFQIGCSCGVAHIPTDAATPEEALRFADQRMYENKAARSSASRQSTDALLTVLSEQSPAFGDHTTGVAGLAQATAHQLGLPAHDIKRVGLAAELHDIGKAAIPDAILNKPGALDDEDWALIRRHTLIGERIVLAAPSLAHTAQLVRSSHERVDGTGYPDALTREDIPLGARIIAVCDAFDAMVSERPYRRAVSTTEALAELRRCSGSQFDPDVVKAFSHVMQGVPA